MSNFQKQWAKAMSEQADLETVFYANFQLRNPGMTIVRIHDSWLFESQQDCQLFTDDLEAFLKERGHR